jgi:hypothetical protein
MLREADQALVSGGGRRPQPEALAAAVRQRRRQARRRAAGALAGVAAIVTAAATLAPRPAGPERRDVAKASPRALEAELARLDAELSTRLTVAKILQTARVESALEPPRAGNAAGDSAVAVRWTARAETIRSAGISWQYADMAERELGDRRRAEQEYRRVVERFPDTSYAKLAADSLARLGPTVN